MAAQARSRVVDTTYWQLLAATIASLFTGGAIAALVKGRADRDVAEINDEGMTERAQIGADNSERISVITTLAARVTVLEESLKVTSGELHALVSENAELRAQNTILREQNVMLRRAIEQTEAERDRHAAEVRTLREAIQGPISDAMEVLESSSEPDDG